MTQFPSTKAAKPDPTAVAPVGAAAGAVGDVPLRRASSERSGWRTAIAKAARYFRFPRDVRLLREQMTQASRELLLATSPQYRDARHLCRAQGQVYSQNGEDGIIAEVFSRIGVRDRYFVEIGVQDGTQNNTRLLLETGWRGIWVDYGSRNQARIEHRFAEYLRDGRLTFVNAMATAETIGDLLAANGAPGACDFLSIDVDANTHHLWRALRMRARVACIEYNSSYPPSTVFELPYDPHATWDRSNRFGASLKSLEQLGRQKDMALVGCDWHGCNAFFVDAPECGDRFIEPFTAEQHYQPPRYSFEGAPGHPPFGG